MSSPVAWIGSMLVITSIWTIDPILRMTYEQIGDSVCRRKSKKNFSSVANIDTSIEMVGQSQTKRSAIE